MYRKGLILQFGLVNVIVGLDGAVEKEASLKTVCVGAEAGAAHAPTPIRQVLKCAGCGEVHSGQLSKAREIGSDQYQVVDQSEVATAKDQTLGATKKMLAITVHDATEVAESVLQGQGVYYVAPEGNSQIGGYSLIADAVKRRQDKAFLLEYTPTSAAGFWQLRVFNDALVIEKRSWPEDVKTAPFSDVVTPDTGLQAQMDQVIDSMTVPFDAASYQNNWRASLDALLATKDTVDGVAIEKVKAEGKTVASSAVVDLSGALNAMLAGTATAPAAPVTRKPRAKKSA